MLEKPAVDDRTIMDCLHTAYGVSVHTLTFLPLGADRHTAVYRAEADDGVYFIKLRSGPFHEASVLLPHFLAQHGMKSVIVPYPTHSGELWTRMEGFCVLLFPFIEGKSGFEYALTQADWVAYGRALHNLHTALLPDSLRASIPREAFSDAWRSQVKHFMTTLGAQPFDDPIAHALAQLLQRKQSIITRLMTYAEQAATRLQAQALPWVVCHADIHVGNLLMTPQGKLYLVDWDTLIQAPKERDLMFIGMGMSGLSALTIEEQQRWFDQGYDETGIDRTAIAYYRCERIVQDIAAYCEQLLFTLSDSADRREGLRQMQNQFEPGAVVEQALHAIVQAASPT